MKFLEHEERNMQRMLEECVAWKAEEIYLHYFPRLISFYTLHTKSQFSFVKTKAAKVIYIFVKVKYVGN